MILSAVRDQIAVSWDGEDLLTVLPPSQRSIVEPLIDGDFVHNLREAGFTVMVDQRVVEARLLEHPGHADQKVHGRRGGGGDLAGLDAELRSVRGAERLVAMKDGKVVLDMGGAGNSIQLNHEADMKLKGTIASHNHPTGWESPEGTIERNGNGPSQPDLETAWRAGVEEMRIVTPGSVYSVKQGSDTTWGGASDARQKEVDRYGPVPAITNGKNYSPAEQGMNTALQSISDRVHDRFLTDINMGRKTIGQAQMAHYDEVLRQASKDMGWEISITRTKDYVPLGSGPSVTDPRPPQSIKQFDFKTAFGESLERRVARELIRHTVRLLEHPGHADQKVHGHRGIGATQQTGDLSPKVQDAIHATAARMGLDSPGAMADRMDRVYDSATPEQIAAGKDWYANAHDSAQAAADAGGWEVEQTAAVMAVYSPGREWGSNVRAAGATFDVVGGDKRFYTAGGEPRSDPVAAGYYRPSQLTAHQLAYAHPAFSSDKTIKGAPDHYRQVERSIDLLRGDTTPELALTGPKTRNFNNNILNPNDPRYVTVDAWMYRAALGPGATVTLGTGTRATQQNTDDWSYGDFGSKMGSSPTVGSEGYRAGMYPHFAEAIHIGAARHGIEPQQYQAIVWEAARANGLQP